MKLLFLVQNEQRIILDRFYDAIAEQFEQADVRRLNSAQQANLKEYFEKNIVVDKYDRIMLFLRFKKEEKQYSFLRTIPNLVFLEHDAYQNYISCKYKERFSRHYKKTPWVRVLTSGYEVSQRLQSEGVDAIFVPKCYDNKMIKNAYKKRDIELAFIGSTKSKTYSQRRTFLDQLEKEENLLITRTSSGTEYTETLNRIKFFISADIGMGEYMIKNFEAMAAGCVLFAWNQGNKENEALGFKDMKNIVLYNSKEELKQKLEKLRQCKELVELIATNGQALAEQQYSYKKVAQKIHVALQPRLRRPKKMRRLIFDRYSYDII